MLNIEKIYKILKTILILIPIITFVWIIDRNFVFSGHMNTSYTFDKNNPFTSILTPAGRALKIERNDFGDYSQKIIIDPVYFNLYSPTKFKTAKFTFTYKNPLNRDIKIGQKIFNDDWSYWFENLRCDENIGGWCVGRVEFDLTKASLDKRNIKFMISSPGLDKSGGEIEITTIEVELIK